MEPGVGFHATRIGDYALYDILGTIAGAGAIAYYFNYNFLIVLFILVILGIIMHYIFDIDTAFNKQIYKKINQIKEIKENS